MVGAVVANDAPDSEHGSHVEAVGREGGVVRFALDAWTGTPATSDGTEARGSASIRSRMPTVVSYSRNLVLGLPLETLAESAAEVSSGLVG